MPWTEHAVKGLVLLGLGTLGGFLAARSQQPLLALVGCTLAAGMCWQAVGCFQNGVTTAWKQLPSESRYRTLS